jgi:hypothetical protein
MEKEPQKNPFEMQKIGDLSSERLLSFIEKAESPEEAIRIIGEEEYERLLKLQEQEKEEKKYQKIEQEKERSANIQEDREETRNLYRRR